MPFDGSGNYTPAAAPNFPAIGGEVISSVYYNAVINDLAAGLSLCLTRDGQGKPSANINWNAKNLTNVATFGAVSGAFSAGLTAATLGLSGALTGATATFTSVAISGALSAGSLTLTTALPVAQGGSGSTTPAAARTAFGATTVGSNLFTLANPSAITFARINADNTVSLLNATDFRSAIGAGTGNGSVTSVGGTGTVNGLTLTGSVTSSGNLTLGGTLTGVSLTTAVAGVLPLANGGTGGSTAAAARTNLGAAALGANADITTLQRSVTIAATGPAATANSLGYLGLPLSAKAQGSTITPDLDDIGRLLVNTAGGWTIPSNASVPYPIGTVLPFYNDSGSSQSLSITSDTLRLNGTATTGTRTVGQRTLATATKVKATEWVASGVS